MNLDQETDICNKRYGNGQSGKEYQTTIQTIFFLARFTVSNTKYSRIYYLTVIIMTTENCYRKKILIGLHIFFINASSNSN